MPSVFIRSSMTQNGVVQPLECTIFEGVIEGPSVTIKGGPFTGQKYTREDLMNLIMQLDDLRVTLHEVADAAKT